MLFGNATDIISLNCEQHEGENIRLLWWENNNVGQYIYT